MDAELGRFVGRDPVPAVNAYAYATGSPANGLDPMGLEVCDPACGNCPPVDCRPGDVCFKDDPLKGPPKDVEPAPRDKPADQPILHGFAPSPSAVGPGLAARLAAEAAIRAPSAVRIGVGAVGAGLLTSADNPVASSPEECASIWGKYNPGGMPMNCPACLESDGLFELYRKIHCFTRELSLRKEYVDKRCDYALLGSINSKQGSAGKERGHRQQIADKAGALARCQRYESDLNNRQLF